VQSELRIYVQLWIIEAHIKAAYFINILALPVREYYIETLKQGANIAHKIDE